MCYTGGPRCPKSARTALQRALATKDPAKIKAARVEWYTTEPGIEELRKRGREDAAAKFEARRQRLIELSKRRDRMDKGITVAIDLDNTTADFNAAFRAALAKKYGLTPEEALERYPDPDNYDYATAGWFESKEEFRAEMREAEENGMYENLPIFSGARETIRNLRENGYKVHFLTARDKAFTEHTKAALRKYRVGYDALVHDNNKHDYAPAHVFIDDAPYQVDNLTANGRPVIVFGAKYNENITHAPRVKSWREVGPLIDQQTREARKAAAQAVEEAVKHVD